MDSDLISPYASWQSNMVDEFVIIGINSVASAKSLPKKILHFNKY
jgi:hypothetical protein